MEIVRAPYRLAPRGTSPRRPSKGHAVNKSDLIEVVSQRLGDRRTASTAVEAVVDAITRAVAKGEKVGISGFGVFEPVDRAARTARNPTTGEAVKLQKTRVPKFRPGQGFKDIVSGAKKVDPVAGARAVTARAGVPRAPRALAEGAAATPRATAARAAHAHPQGRCEGTGAGPPRPPAGRGDQGRQHRRRRGERQRDEGTRQDGAAKATHRRQGSAKRPRSARRPPRPRARAAAAKAARDTGRRRPPAEGRPGAGTARRRARRQRGRSVRSASTRVPPAERERPDAALRSASGRARPAPPRRCSSATAGRMARPWLHATTVRPDAPPARAGGPAAGSAASSAERVVDLERHAEPLGQLGDRLPAAQRRRRQHRGRRPQRQQRARARRPASGRRSSSGRSSSGPVPVLAAAGAGVPHQQHGRRAHRAGGEAAGARRRRRRRSPCARPAGPSASAARRPRRWARSRRRRACSAHQRTVLGTSRPAVEHPVAGAAQAAAQHGAEAGLLLHLAHRGRRIELAGVELALGQRPVVVPRPVHDGDLDPAVRLAPQRPRRRPARALDLATALSRRCARCCGAAGRPACRGSARRRRDAAPSSRRAAAPSGGCRGASPGRTARRPAAARPGPSGARSVSTRRSRLRCMRSALPSQCSTPPSSGRRTPSPASARGSARRCCARGWSPTARAPPAAASRCRARPARPARRPGSPRTARR